MQPKITKKVSATISSVNHFFKDRFLTVISEHKAIGGALAKCHHDITGFRFEFTKMELASMDERNRFIDNPESLISFEDNFQRITFAPKDCSEFSMKIGLSGFTSVSGVIAEFTTHSFEEYSTGFYRAVIPTRSDFINSQYFAVPNGLQIENSVYGSGVLEFNTNEISLHSFTYAAGHSEDKFYIIEAQQKCQYEDFIKILDEILLAITYLTSHFLGEEIYILASEDSSHQTSEIISLKRFFEDLRNGKNAVPNSNVFHNLRIPVQLSPPYYFGKLITNLTNSLILKRAVLLLCQAHTEPQYVRSSLYSVALETITSLITENLKEKANPLADKPAAKSIIASLKKTLSSYESVLPATIYETFARYIERINSPTNKQKLLIPFQHFGIRLPDQDVDAIGKRNDFLHGRMPELNNDDELIILNNRILFCIDCLILKYVGYEGFVMYHSAIHQLRVNKKLEEYPIRKI